MPVQSCEENGLSGFSCGSEGKCYLVRDHGEDKAKQLACEQCLAIGEPCSEGSEKNMTRIKPKNKHPRRPHSEWITIKGIEWKEIGENIVEAYGSVFGGPPDEHNDVISHGAFRKTIKERINKNGIPFIDSHIYDSSHTIGTVFQAREDKHGLRFKAKISNTQSAQEIKQKMVEGILTKFSIGFETVKEHYGKDEITGKNVRFLDEIKLYEISVVPIPALDRTELISIKSVIPYQDLPLSDLDHEWNEEEARQRVKSFLTNDDKLDFIKYRKSFIWHDIEKPDQIDSYHLLVTDVIDGTIKAVPNAVFSVANALHEDNDINVPEEHKNLVKKQLEHYYAKMREEFDDDSIIVPWEMKNIVMKHEGFHFEEMDDEKVLDFFDAVEDLYIRFGVNEENINHFIGMGSAVLSELINRGVEPPNGDFLTLVMENISGEPVQEEPRRMDIPQNEFTNYGLDEEEDEDLDDDDLLDDDRRRRRDSIIATMDALQMILEQEEAKEKDSAKSIEAEPKQKTLLTSKERAYTLQLRLFELNQKVKGVKEL